MSKKNPRKETEASKFLGDSPEASDVSEAESAADSASEKASEPSPKAPEPKQDKPAAKIEKEIPAKFRKFQ